MEKVKTTSIVVYVLLHMAPCVSYYSRTLNNRGTVVMNINIGGGPGGGVGGTGGGFGSFEFGFLVFIVVVACHYFYDH